MSTQRTEPTLDDVRHAAQSALVQLQPDWSFGTANWASLPDDLVRAGADATSPAWLDGGLTARVRHVARAEGAVALKQARRPCLVQNKDGELSFANEFLRRKELLDLTQLGRGIEGLTPTLHASLSEGVIVTPWLDGGLARVWEERQLLQLFDMGTALILEGFFEWDYSPGNIIDDGQRLWLFDFGYMYRFDPLRHFNTAGDGRTCPQLHLAERFETRNFFGHLLQREETHGVAAALDLFRLEKSIALESYQRLYRNLASRGAEHAILSNLARIIREWQQALHGDLGALYLREGWRSHEADLHDDLSGQTCTPMTLRRTQWLIARAQDDYATLHALGAVQAGIEQGALVESLHEHLATATRYQIPA